MSTETMKFKTEMKQLMDIIINSLYSHKEIFLRELVSNACDAIDKIRFESLTKQEVLEGNADWKIKITADKDKKTILISDNGVGMSRETIVDNIGTIAKSGTTEFLQRLKEADEKSRPELIGQFGVGFYSTFMVADKVTVISRMAGGKGIKWESDGQGEFNLEDADKEKRGTDIILHLKDEEKEFLEEWKIRSIVKKYSDFIEHPIVMDVEKEDEKDKKKKNIEEETLNSRKAIWQRAKNEIKEEEHKEFYKHIAHDWEDPHHTIHYSAEGALEFKALLYLPGKRPMDMFMPEAKMGINLYIKRVFIMDDCKEMLPEYFRFVKGVVDSSDLPLNVSREMLQHSAVLEKIKKNLVNKLISELGTMKKKSYDHYLKLYKEFASVLKEGVHSDWDNKEKLADLLLFASEKTESDKFISLEDYVKNMPAEQEDIYYITGESRAQLENSPYLERFKSRGHDVLFMTDTIDEWVTQSLTEYKKKKLKAINKGDIEESKVEEAKKDEHKKKYKKLIKHLKDKLPEVKEVRLSGRLTDSAACLVADEGEMTANMEQIMKQLGQSAKMPDQKRILEINPSHAVVKAMQTIYEGNNNDIRVEEYVRVLYNQAVLAEGSKLKDPQSFATLINKYMVKDSLTV